MSFDAEYYAETIRDQRKVARLVALLGSIPLNVGRKLRQRFYPFIFGAMGSNVDIETGIRLVCSQAIELGHDVSILSHVMLDCGNPGSQLTIRDHTKLDQGVHIQALGGAIEIGSHTYLGPYVCLAGPGNITIGNDCLIASHSGFYANNHIFDDPTQRICQQGAICKGIVVEDDCWLGCGVRILDGVTIGEGSVVGAGAVVTKPIPPYSVAVGVPAHVISKREVKAMG